MVHRTHISLHPQAERTQFRADLLTPVGHYDLEVRPSGLQLLDSAFERTELPWDCLFAWRECSEVIVIVTAERRAVLVPTERCGDGALDVLRAELGEHCKRR